MHPQLNVHRRTYAQRRRRSRALRPKFSLKLTLVTMLAIALFVSATPATSAAQTQERPAERDTTVEDRTGSDEPSNERTYLLNDCVLSDSGLGFSSIDDFVVGSALDSVSTGLALGRRGDRTAESLANASPSPVVTPDPVATPSPPPQADAGRGQLDLDANKVKGCGPTATATVTPTVTTTVTVTPTPTATPQPYDVDGWCAELALAQCGVASVALTPPTTSNDPFGSVGSEVMIDASGAATWSMQVDGPRGGPMIGIDFSSSRGDGDVGVGFGLTGTSAITRCPRTALYDNVVEAVDYAEPIQDANWCIDGAPLDNVGTATGTVSFATSVWSTSELTLFTGDGLGTSHFVLEDGAGRQHLYKPIVAQRLGSDIVFSYVRTMTEDTFGNTRSYHWNVDSTDGLSYWLEQVSWGGNIATQEPNLWGARIIRNPRPERVRYIDGVKLRSDRVIRSIIVASLDDPVGGVASPAVVLNGHAGSGWETDLDGQAILNVDSGTRTPFKRYLLETVAPLHDTRYYLQSVELCEEYDPAAEEWTLCFEPTTFEWSGLKADDDTDAFPDIREQNDLFWSSPYTVTNLADENGQPRIRSPFAAQETMSRRSFSVGAGGDVVFRDRSDGVGAVAVPPVAFDDNEYWVMAQPVPGVNHGFQQLRVVLTEPADGVDVLRLVTDRDYFHSLSSADCLDLHFPDHISWTPDTLLATGFPLMSCGISDVVDGAETSDDDDEAALACAYAAYAAGDPVYPCYEDHPDFIMNAYFDGLRNSFGTLADDIVRRAHGLFGDFDGDGIEDRLRLDLFNQSASAIELSSGVSATLPTFGTTVGIDPIWGGGIEDLASLSEKVGDALRRLSLNWQGIVVADFTGDGLADIYQPWGNGTVADRVYVTTVDGSGNLSWTLTTGPTTTLESVSAANPERVQERGYDLNRYRLISANGDRCPDIYFFRTGVDSVFLAPCGAMSWQTETGLDTTVRISDLTQDDYGGPLAILDDGMSITDIDLTRVQFAEFNGDGCTDALVAPVPSAAGQAGSGTAVIWYSTCAGTFVNGGPSPVAYSYHSTAAAVGYSMYSPSPAQISTSLLYLSTEPPTIDPWTAVLSELNRVRTGDVNGDGLADLMVMDPTAFEQVDHLDPIPEYRDTIYLNKGDGTWATMDGIQSGTSQSLGSGITNVATPPNDRVHEAPFWSFWTKVPFDLNRHQLVPYGDDHAAGLWVGGAMIWSRGTIDLTGGGWAYDADCQQWNDWMEQGGFCINEFDWYLVGESYIPSQFDRVELASVTNGTGTTTEIGYGWYRSTDDATAPDDSRAKVRVANRLSKSLQATSGGQLREVEHATEYAFSGMKISNTVGSLGFQEVVATQTLPEGEGRTRTTVSYEHRQHMVGTPHTTKTEVSVNCTTPATCSWQMIERDAKRLGVVALNSVPGHESRDFTAVRLEPFNDCTGGPGNHTGYWGTTSRWTLSDAVISRECQVDGPLDSFGNPAWTRVEFGDGRIEQATWTYSDDHHRRFRLPTTHTMEITDITGDQSCEFVSTVYGATNLQAESVTASLVDDACNPTGVERYETTSYDSRGLVATARTGGTNTDERVTRNTYGTGLERSYLTEVESLRSLAGGGEAYGPNWISSFQTPHRSDWEWETPGTVAEDDGVVLSGDRLLTTTTLDGAGRVLEVASGLDNNIVSHRWNDAPSASERDLLGGVTRDWTVSNTDGFGYEVRDRAGRVVRSADLAAAGFVVTDTWYDDRGRIAETSPAYVVADDTIVDRSRLMTVDAFDPLGRPVQQTDLAGVITTHTYDHGGWYGTSGSPFISVWTGWVKNDRTTVDGVQSVVHRDASNRVIATTNALGETTSYRYNASGAVTGIQDAAGNLTEVLFDNWDRKVSSIDPDLGAFSYEHNVFGDVTRQVDPLNTAVEATFDRLGRPLSRTVTDVSGTVFDTELWHYDIDATANNAWGKLAVRESNNERIEYHYDGDGRLVWTEVDGDANGNQSFVDTHITYDGFGRPLDTRYEHPAGSFTKTNVWDPDTSALTAIEDLNGHTLWAMRGFDSMGTPVLFEHGNSTATYRAPDLDHGQLTRIETRGPGGSVIQDVDLTWNSRGNLDALTNNAAGLAETFTYDDLDRLSTSQVGGQAIVDYSFDTIGNLTHKSDFSTSDYVYGSSRPHAVTQVGNETYEYRPDGQLEFHKVDGAVVRQFAYTPQRLMAYALMTAPVDEPNRINFAYGTNDRRIRQAIRDGSNNVLEWSWYLDENVRHTSNGVKVTLTAPTGTIAELDGADWLWLHTDHLGSTEAVTDGDGQMIQRLSYAPFGQPRDASSGALFDGAAAAAIVEDGFTGHDRVDAFGLVNMRARMYDPALGRFVQPDTIIQSKFDNQTLARYSYTRGNPLRYNDPSGHVFNTAAVLSTFFLQSALSFGFGAIGLPAPQVNYQSFHQIFAAAGPSSSTYTEYGPAVAVDLQRVVDGTPQVDHITTVWLPYRAESPDSLAPKGVTITNGFTRAMNAALSGTAKGISLNLGLSGSNSSSVTSHLTLAAGLHLDLKSRRVGPTDTCPGDCRSAAIFYKAEVTWEGYVRPIYETTEYTSPHVNTITTYSRTLVGWDHGVRIKEINFGGWDLAFTPPGWKQDIDSFTSNMMDAFAAGSPTGWLSYPGNVNKHARAYINNFWQFNLGSPVGSFKFGFNEWGGIDYGALFEQAGGRHYRGVR